MMTSFFAALCMAATTYVKPDVSFQDGCETFAINPARGLAGGGWVTFKPEGLPKWHGQGGFHSSLWELSRFSGGREQKGKRPDPARVGTADIPLTAAMKADVRRFLDETRAKGGSLIVRLGYTWSEQVGCEPSDFEVLLGHVRELSAIMAGYEDVVVGVEAGVAGPWGEMHSSDYCEATYMNRILTTYLDSLGPRIPVLVRAPNYFCKLAETDVQGLLDRLPFKDRHLRRLGMYNDGYLGTWWDYGTWAGDFTRERGCQLLKACDHVPYGGEMAYVGKDWIAQNREKCRSLFDPEKWNIVRDWYDVQLCYLRNIAEGGHTLAEFLKKELVFDSKKWAFEGMPDLHEYDGKDMNKFVADHMGYRFVVRDARLPSTLTVGRPVRLALDVENTGFGRLLLPAKTEVLLAKDGQVESFPATFDLDLRGGERRRLAVDFTLPASSKTRGDCTLLLRLSAPLKDEDSAAAPRRPIRLANEAMWDEALSANRIGATRIADAKLPSESLREKIAKTHKVTGEDMWNGYRRTKFEFGGRAAWVVEPWVAPAGGRPWTWTMQWAEAFVDRTGVLDLLKRGYRHVTIDLFDTRMNEDGIAVAAAFQSFLVGELGFAPKANLVGMSWGGFFSTRYAAAHPENVAKIYLDAPLLTFDGFGSPDPDRIGVWAARKPEKGVWADDPEMPVNIAGRIAAAKIPILLVYGGADTLVPPKQNSETFAERFKAAGGSIVIDRRGLFGHHPHGYDAGKTGPIVDFIDRASP